MKKNLPYHMGRPARFVPGILLGGVEPRKERAARKMADEILAGKRSAGNGRDCHGFRKLPGESSVVELAEMWAAEDASVEQPRRFYNMHPSSQNGRQLLPKYRRMLDRAQAREQKARERAACV